MAVRVEEWHESPSHVRLRAALRVHTLQLEDQQGRRCRLESGDLTIAGEETGTPFYGSVFGLWEGVYQWSSIVEGTINKPQVWCIYRHL